MCTKIVLTVEKEDTGYCTGHEKIIIYTVEKNGNTVILHVVQK